MPSFWEALVGRKPTVPEVPPLSLPEEQQKAIKANVAAAPGASELAFLSQEQITKMMELAAPGFGQVGGQVMKNALSLLRGEIPLDVSQEVKRQGAGRALTGGFAGTDAANNLVARDLGLTSLGLTREGLSSAESWISKMEQLYSPSQALFTGMFITPQQQFAAATQERNLQYQQDWLAEQISAMPAPWAEDLKQFIYRAMSAYGGTPVKNNPYSTPGSFGGVGGGGGNVGGGGIGWNAGNWQSSNVGPDWTPSMANDSSAATDAVGGSLLGVF